jgi:hypothetical protein
MSTDEIVDGEAYVQVFGGVGGFFHLCPVACVRGECAIKRVRVSPVAALEENFACEYWNILKQKLRSPLGMSMGY